MRENVRGTTVIEGVLYLLLAIGVGCGVGLFWTNYSGNSGFEVEWWDLEDNVGALLIIPIPWSDPIDVVVSWEGYDSFELYKFDNDLDVSPIAGEKSYLIEGLNDDEFIIFHAYGDGHFEVEEWF